ncbi:hypothetical protein [Pleionea sediminis]|uniref:hypothetical protein n=1 Tax=Pleionea sediminis TaxID=2569479 RepID=UPI0011863950|nr:hypothetical protein [Pleionea sediminis]
MKKIAQLVSLIALSTAASLSSADEEKNVSVFVKKMNDDDTQVELKVNNKVDIFNLPELSKGEEHTFTSKSGTVYTISNSDGNIKIVSEGAEDIIIPLPDKNHLVAKVKALSDRESLHQDDAIRIMAAGLTDDQKETIKASIAAAGIVKPVKFVEHRMLFITDDADTGDVRIERKIRIEHSHEEVEIPKSNQ